MARKQVESDDWSTRKRSGQTVLSPIKKASATRQKLTAEEKELRREAKMLGQLHKHVKAGLVNPDHLSEKQKFLLVKYYGYSWEKDAQAERH